MATVEERLAMLEGRMDGMGDLRTLIATLGDQMNRGFEQVRVEIGELRGELRAGMGELRGELRAEMGELRGELRAEMGGLRSEMGRETAAVRLEVGDLRGEMGRRFEHLDRRITAVDEKNDRHFTWLVGLQLTMMLAVIGVLLAAYLR
jgi:hypothetical protein